MDKLILNENNVLLNLPAESKFLAIERIGDLMVKNGYVQREYIEGMKARERSLTAYIGNGIAIPHGLPEYIKYINKSGIIVAQYPGGIDFGEGNTAYILIGIAGKGNEHIDILSNIAIVCQNEENVERLKNALSEKEIIEILTEEKYR